MISYWLLGVAGLSLHSSFCECGGLSALGLIGDRDWSLRLGSLML